MSSVHPLTNEKKIEKTGATTECRAKIKAISLAARLARQWMKERGMICILVKCWVRIFSGSFGSAVQTSRLVWWMVKSGPVFCSLAKDLTLKPW